MSTLVDPANGLLAPGDARMETGSVTLPGGARLGVVTMRTSSATLTVFLGPEDLRQWGEMLTALGSQLGGAVAPATVADMSLLGQLRRPDGTGH